MNTPIKHQLLGVRSLLLLLLLLLPLHQAGAAPMADLLTEARALLTANPPQPQQALSLLLKQEESFAGDLEYDYWLGVAATRSREPSLALMALNRILIQQPLHAGARLERVGAYLQLGREEDAKRDLDRLEELSPPPQAQLAINRYREALQERERHRSAPSHLAMLTTEMGYDTNVGRTPDGYEHCIPTALFELLRFFVGEDGRCNQPLSEEASAYSTLRGVYRYRRPFDENNRLDATLVGQYRSYQKDGLEGYNLGAVQGRASWRHSLSMEEFITLDANLSRIWIDQPLEGYLWQPGVAASWERPLSDQTSYRLAGHWRLNAHDGSSRNDFHLWGLDNQLRFILTPRLHLQTNLLLEYEAADDSRNGGDLQRLRLGLAPHYQINQHHSLRTHLGFTRLLYQEKGFQIMNASIEPSSRRDSRWEASLDYNWMLNPRWMFNLQAQHRRQVSSIEFYENNQSLIQAGITYIWQGTGQR